MKEPYDTDSSNKEDNTALYCSSTALVETSELQSNKLCH